MTERILPDKGRWPQKPEWESSASHSPHEAPGCVVPFQHGHHTQIRREFHSFPSKVAEIPAFVSKMLHQSLDFHKRSFSAPGVLIYESGGVSHPPTFG